MKGFICLSLCCLFFVGCATNAPQVYYVRSDVVRPGMSLQQIFDTANSIPNCHLEYQKLAESTDSAVYRMAFISSDRIVRPYICTFTGGSLPTSQTLLSIELDQAQLERNRNAEIQRLNGLMWQHNQLQQDFNRMIPPPVRRY